MDFSIVVYTHTDMEDVWPVFFGELNRYINDTKIYVAVNKFNDSLSQYEQIIYDDSKEYTERWKEILSKIDDEIIMFIHEDMILYDTPIYEKLNLYARYILEDTADSIKLIHGGNNLQTSNFDDTLVYNNKTKISIQPTLIKRKNFVSLLNSVSPLNIWDFEREIPATGNHYMVRLGMERKRGIHHYDSVVFPYIATAINKGKWNMSEYQTELDTFFKMYNINPFERGIV
jgi:hypothetical protein